MFNPDRSHSKSGGKNKAEQNRCFCEEERILERRENLKPARWLARKEGHQLIDPPCVEDERRIHYINQDGEWVGTTEVRSGKDHEEEWWELR